MATAKISKRSVDALSPPPPIVKDTADPKPTAAYLWDSELAGFGVRITSNGAKAYIYQYRTGGRESVKKRHTIGKHGSPWTPDTARSEAKRLATLVGRGTDPVDADRERRRQAVDLAFSSYVDTFANGYLKSHWKDWEQGKSLLVRHAVPVLKAKPLPLIKKSDVVAVLDGLADKPAVARLMHATLRKMFKWAASERGDIERSPIEGMSAPAGVASRDRVLSDDELAVVWNATGDLGFPFGPMFRLLIVTGQRREEVAALDWGELDRASATWTLPADRAKNGNAHIVPLSALAVEQMDELAKILNPDAAEIKWPRRGLVFSTTGKTAASGHSKAKARLDRQIEEDLMKRAADASEAHHPMPAWRVHDLRRTVATGLQRLGIRFEVTEAVLNHVSGSRSGVAGVYQRHDWKEEKRAALDAWARHIEAVLAPADRSNVVSIETRAA